MSPNPSPPVPGQGPYCELTLDEQEAILRLRERYAPQTKVLQAAAALELSALDEPTAAAPCPRLLPGELDEELHNLQIAAAELARQARQERALTQPTPDDEDDIARWLTD